ncbi:hypothetical protein BGZ46_009306, partial [Entomortierella lignicola]
MLAAFRSSAPRSSLIRALGARHVTLSNRYLSSTAATFVNDKTLTPTSLQAAAPSSISSKPATSLSTGPVPGSDERKLKSSLSLSADCLVYDLEDGVSHNRKNIAREMVFDALEASEHRKAEKAVRINAVGSGLEFDDLNVVLRSSRLQAIVIPKVQSAKDIQFVCQMVDSVAPSITRANVRILASIESALGVMNLKEIATADPRVDALV